MTYSSPTVDELFDNVPLEESSQEVRLLIDGDLFIHRAANATDGRQYTVEEVNIFKYKKDAVEFCISEGLDPKEDILLDFDPEPFEHAIAAMKGMLNSVMHAFTDVDTIISEVFITSSTNYRNDILEGYKGSRKTARRPHHLAACKEWLIDNYGAILKEGFEADDLLGIRATELQGLGVDCCIVSIDKDLLTIPGNHYNFVKDIKKTVSEDEAMFWYYNQCLTGDKTDDIPGLFRIGEKTADKILKNADGVDEISLYLAVATEWIKRNPKITPDEALDLQEASAKCLWIQREMGVIWKPPLSRRDTLDKVLILGEDVS